jgi:hypothetical protein
MRCLKKVTLAVCHLRTTDDVWRPARAAGRSMRVKIAECRTPSSRFFFGRRSETLVMEGNGVGSL